VDTSPTELVVVEGADAVTYLDSQCTQDLSGLAVGSVAATFVLDPKGELVTVAVVRAVTPSLVELEVPTGTATATIARLERFAIRADVAMRRGGTPPTPVYVDELARIDATVPGTDELSHALVPHGVSAELRERCVSFTKGCYPGQELVARMQARSATPPYVLAHLVADVVLRAGDPAGTSTLEGAVTSVALDASTGRWHALGVLHRKDAAAGTVEVRTATGAQVAQLD
jgi:folate-binding protein YgfZ